VVSMNDIYEMQIDPVTGDGFMQIPGLGSVYDYIVVVPSLVTAENIGGHFAYWHNGDISYSPPASGGVAATFLIFKNAQNNIIDELDKALYLYDRAERNGYDVSGLDQLFDSVNSDVSKANSGVNWVFRAGKLMSAIDTLEIIIDRLILMMG
ncbi:MAG: hypothetical protein JW825_02255, partial [Candidatus Methanofastidiosa archaeon]|nr:hypothetical protein [Candidatus Methanofastidiosa archaeon]